MNDGLYDQYDSIIPLVCPGYNKCLDLIVNNIPSDAKKIVDLGSGTGTLLLSITEKKPGIKATGVELQEELVSISKKKIRNALKNNITIVNEDIRDYEIKDMDVVISSLVIHHLSYNDKKKLLKKIYSNSKCFIYFDRVKGKNTEEEKSNLAKVVGYARSNKVPEEFINHSLKEMKKKDKPLTLEQQTRMFEQVGFKYKILYMENGFSVYFCSKKE